ncbi:MAG: HAD family hydrolase [Spirochaetes bacterium]|nr:HAD family hydrolase [Spirochaetota bacterium]
MNFKGIIFDMDGTLLDTIDDLADSMNAVLKKQNFPPHPVQSYNIFVGDGAKKLVERSLPESNRSEKIIEYSLALLNEEYQERYNHKTKLYHGIKELLDKLSQKEVSLNIFSNKNDDFVLKLAEEYFQQWKFDCIRGAQPGFPKKPSPDGALFIANQLNLLPEHILYIGDTDTDMKTAISAGMQAVGVSWGFRSAEELKENGARWILHHPLELIKLFD